jgi:hypothetical protein
MDQHRREFSRPVRITGQPVDPKLALVKKFIFPVDSRHRLKGM